MANSATGDPIHFMFGSRVGFSETADRTALLTVRTNPRWRPPPCWKNFKCRYLRNRSSDPVSFLGGVFGYGGSNGAISGSNKSKMAAAAFAIAKMTASRGHLCYSTAFLFYSYSSFLSEAYIHVMLVTLNDRLSSVRLQHFIATVANRDDYSN